MPSRITDASVEAMLTREKAHFLQRNPKSRTLAEESSGYWLRGVPMHWMEASRVIEGLDHCLAELV